AEASNYYTFDADFLAMLDAAQISPREWTRLHSEKVGPPELFRKLADRGLIRELHSKEWWLMEKRTAGLYMAYLVGSICREEEDLFPVTDESASLVELTQPMDDTRLRLDSLLSVTISDALPVPSQTIPVEEIARFKNDHEEQLHRLRIYLKDRLA